MGKTYDYNPAIEYSFREYCQRRQKNLVSIIIQSVLCIAFFCFVLYEDMIGIEGVVFKFGNNSENNAYMILFIWMFCIIVKLVLHYMEDIPLLRTIQDKMERKHFEKLKKTYEYQVKLNDNN